MSAGCSVKCLPCLRHEPMASHGIVCTFAGGQWQGDRTMRHYEVSAAPCRAEHASLFTRLHTLTPACSTFCLLTISPPLTLSLSLSLTLSLPLTLYVTEVRFAYDSLLQLRRGIPSNEYLLMIRIVHFALCSLFFIDIIRTQQQTKPLSLSPQYLFFISLFILSYLLFLKRKWMRYNWLQEKMSI